MTIIVMCCLQKSKKPAAVGYEEGSTLLYRTASVADFIMSDEHLQLLSSVNKLVFDEHSKVSLGNVLLECFIRVFYCTPVHLWSNVCTII